MRKIGWILLALPIHGMMGATSPVADAVMNNDSAALDTLLRQKADVNAPQADGATAIHWAAWRDDLDMAGRLIAAGANVKMANREGSTPLQLASTNGSAAMIGRGRCGRSCGSFQPSAEHGGWRPYGAGVRRAAGRSRDGEGPCRSQS